MKKDMTLLERFLERTEFSSYEDFYENYRLRVPERFNFGFDVVDAWAEAQPLKRALLWCDDTGEERDFTFSDMKRLSAQAARFFQDIGVRKGDFVMLILKQRFEYWICAVALHKLGAVVIPATSQLTQKDVAYRNNAAGVHTVVALAAAPGLVPAIFGALPESPTVKNVVLVGGDPADATAADADAAPSVAPSAASGVGVYRFDDEVYRRPADFPRPPEAEQNRTTDRFLMYFTSGTTGMPKMVMHDYAYPLGHITTAKYWQRVTDGGLHMTVSDSGWAKFGWGKIYGQWIAGSAIFAWDMERFSPQGLLEVMQKYPITTFCAPPTMYRFMIQEDVASYDLSSITHYTTAGEPLNPEVFRKWEAFTGKGIWEGFGQSESQVILANFEWFDPRPGSMGKPSPPLAIAALDENDNPADSGMEGRVVVRRPGDESPVGIFRYYYKDEALTGRVFTNGYYNTGDMAWVDSDGYYWFVGRDDDIIKCSGYRIGPFEVESALLEHPAVVECAITAAPDALRGQVVKATVVLARGYAPSEALTRELQAHVKKVTAPYKYPRIVEYVDELPKTVGGKIRRAQIRAQSNGTRADE